VFDNAVRQENSVCVLNNFAVKTSVLAQALHSVASCLSGNKWLTDMTWTVSRVLDAPAGHEWRWQTRTSLSRRQSTIRD